MDILVSAAGLKIIFACVASFCVNFIKAHVCVIVQVMHSNGN